MDFKYPICKKLSIAISALAFFNATSDAAGTRYKDRLFDVFKESNITYIENVPTLNSFHAISKLIFASGDSIFFYTNEIDTSPTSLKMDLYTPKNDEETNRAAVIVIHGGSMVGGSKSDPNQISISYCDSLAARGFVTTSIQYRRGVVLSGDGNTLSIDSISFSRSVYRATQDINAAVRYMRKNASKLGIDADRIYLIGNSSGAILAIENIYANTEKDFPEYINNDDYPYLGGLNDFGDQSDYFHANGGVFLWGATHNKNIISNSKVPVLLIQNINDKTVPFKTARPLENAIEVLKQNVPNKFVPVVSAMNLKVETPTLYGSYVIDSILTERQVKHETYFVDCGSHEFYDEPEYRDSVQTKVFNFLYKLASSETSAPVSIHKTIAHASGIQMQKGNSAFTVSRGTNLKYTVTDFRGQQVAFGRISAGKTVDLSTLRGGVYALQVQGERSIRFSLSK